MAPHIYNAALGQEVTLTEYAKAGLEGAAIGGVFSVVGGKAVQLAGKAIGGVTGSVVSQGALKVQQATISQELAGIGVRTGVNIGLGAGFGAGVEFVQTGQVTPKSVIIGGAFGAAFSAGSELAGLYAPNVIQAVDSRVQSVRTKVVARQWTLNQLENVDIAYTGAVSSGKRFNPTLSQKVAMKAAGVEPIRILNKDIRLMPTIETSPNAAFDTGLEGTKIFAESNKIKPIGKAGGESFEGTVIMDKSAYQSYKTFRSVEATDAATTFFGLSESPTTKNFTPKSQYDYLGGNKKLLPNTSKPIKSDFISKEAQVFNTNKNVDDYLASLGTETNEPIFKQQKPDLTSERDLFVSGKDVVKPELQIEVQFKKDNKPYADPARFEQAEKVLGKVKLSKSDIKVMEELNAIEVGGEKNRLESGLEGYAVEPTGGLKTVTDIISGRTIDTGRVVSRGSNTKLSKSFIGGSWGRQNIVFTQPNNTLNISLGDQQEEEPQSNISYRNKPSGSFWEYRKQIMTEKQHVRGGSLFGAFIQSDLSHISDVTNLSMTFTNTKLEAKPQDKTVIATQESTMLFAKTMPSTLDIPKDYTETIVTEVPKPITEPSYASIGFISQKSMVFLPDFKLSAGDFGDSFGRKRGVGTRRRRYPILSAKEFLKL